MRVLLTGATGFVGSHMVTALVQSGHHCVAFARRPVVHGSKVTPVQGDILQKEHLRSALKGCDAVIHLVGIIRENPRAGVTFERLHVEATANLLEACKEEGISRLIHVSALGASPNSNARYHRTKYAAEELVRDSGFEHAIFRPSLILGPGSQFVRDMKRMLSLPLVGVLGGDYRLQPVAVGDVTDAFLAALRDDRLLGGTWELCGPEIFTLKALLQFMAKVWDKSPLFFTLPPEPVKAISALLDRFTWFPVTREQITMLEEGSVCGENRLFPMLGINPTLAEEVLKTC